MKNDMDRITYKLKKNPKKKKKEKDSNSSRESLEMELKSFKANEEISMKKTADGEEIKFFFNNPITENKKPKFKISPTSTMKINQKSTLNLLKGQNEPNFKDILLNYVKSPECKTKKKEEEGPIERKSTIIHGNPETVLTLNGDESSNNSKISEKNEENSSKSDSNSNSISDSSKSLKLEDIYSNIESRTNKESNKDKKDKDKNKIDNPKESSYKSNTTSKYDDSMKIFSNSNNSNNNSNNSSKNNEKENKNENNDIKKNKLNEINEIESEKEEANNELKQNNKNVIIKIKSSESNNNQTSNKDSCFNSKTSQNFKGSNGITCNTFTTTTNTHYTHNTQNTNNSSFQSLKINNKKINYNYLCWNNLSLEKKILIKKKSDSAKNINLIQDKDIIKNKENFIKDEKTTIMIFRLKHLDISLDIEKSYIYYFKYLTKLQNQKNHYKNKSSNNINYSNSQKNDSYKNHIEDNNIYYPNEYYINKKNNLHIKSHVSNLFDKLREFKNNS